MKSSLNTTSGTVAEIQINMGIMEAYMLQQKLNALTDAISNEDIEVSRELVAQLGRAFNVMLPKEVDDCSNDINASLFGIKTESKGPKVLGRISLLDEGDTVHYTGNDDDILTAISGCDYIRIMNRDENNMCDILIMKDRVEKFAKVAVNTLEKYEYDYAQAH